MHIRDPAFIRKDHTGNHLYINQYLKSKINSSSEIWLDIASGNLKKYVNEKDFNIFKGPFDIDQKTLLEMAADRDIDQSQSINLFFKTPVSRQYLLDVHIYAWKLGLSTLYYLYGQAQVNPSSALSTNISDECIMCQ